MKKSDGKELWSPLSAAQASRWFLYQLDPASQASHNIVFSARLLGLIDTAQVAGAVQQLVQRHPMLRTRFQYIDGAPAQSTASTVTAPLSVFEAAGMAPAALERRVRDDSLQPFDLAVAPLMRVNLYRVSEQETVFLLVFDHIVGDGWSYWQILEELGTLLAQPALCDAANAAAAPDYFSYVAWQNAWLDSPAAASQAAYWEQALAGECPMLQLPTDRQRPVQSSNRRGIVEFVLPETLTLQLQAFARKQAGTMFTLLLAAYQIFLHRHTGQDQIVVGCPMPGRTDRAWDRVVGDFVNPVALRARFDAGQSLAQLLREVRNTAMRGMSNQDYPFACLVEKLHPSRSGGDDPLFQTMFVFQKARRGVDLLALWDSSEAASVAWGGVHMAPFPVHQSGGGNNALALETIEFDNKLACFFSYDADVFDAATVARMADRFQVLLADLPGDVQRPVSQLALTGAPERALLLEHFNATDADYPQGVLLHGLFEAQVARTPQARALTDAGVDLSYEELNARANQLAHHLLELGVRPDDRVAICVPRGAGMIAALLGILKSGAAYVPLDPGHPAERLAYMLSDSAPVALVTDTTLQHRLAGSMPVLLLDADAAAIAQNLQHNPCHDTLGLDAAKMAYVLYTSGSTGLPKGVMVEHRNVVNLVQHHAATCELSADDRVLQFASFGFDNSIAEIFPALSVGATIVIRPDELVTPDAHFVAFLNEHGVTVTDLPTAFWHQWAQEIRLRRAIPGPSLRLVVAGGEKAELRHLANWLAEPGLRQCRWLNTYGPTEASVNATTIGYDAGSSLPEHEIPIGRPIANTRVYILDRHLQPAPLGVAGEIHIGGAGVARGYLNRPELTAERFIADPFSAQPGARLYKTGDLGRWLPDGSIAYMGRNDFQVKIRGFRIELGEIEAALAACEGVREAIVIAREDRPGEKRLVAYLLAQDGVTLSVPALRATLSATLADYMVPSAYVCLDAYPLNQNGKLDRRALPAPDLAAVDVRDYEAAQGPTETVLAMVWAELLHLEKVGRHDHFFELGGHSLMVISLIERLRQQDLNADVRTVFAAPTLADMAAAIDRGRHADAFVAPPNLIAPGCGAITPDLLPLVTLTQDEIDAIVALVPGGAANIQDIYPLAPLQEGILFHHLLEQEGDAYLLRSVLSFDSRQRLDAFVAALQAVIDRHDILRTAIHWNGLPQPVQVVLRRATLMVEELRLTGGGDAVTQLQALTDPRHVRLDLAQAPLLGVFIARDPESDAWHLALLDHHMVCDHLTLAFILEEIQVFMRGEGASLAPSLPYRNFIAQTQAVPQTRHEDYFRQQLSDVAEPTAPFGLLDVQSDGVSVAQAHLAVDDALAQQLRECARREGITPAVLFHVAWALVLGQCSGRDDVVFGTVLSGRLQGTDGADRVLGMFINALPVRIVLAEHAVRDVVRAAYRHLSELLVHEQASLALAQRCSGIAPPLPLFTSLLNFRHTHDNISADGVATFDWEGIRVVPGEERTNYPMTVSVDDLGEGFALTAQCASGIDPHAMLAYFETAVANLVEALGTQPAQAIGQVRILPPAERTRLLEQYNDSANPYPQAKQLIHQLFEEVAARQGDAIALVYEDEQLSYGALNRRANQLAHHLLTLGVQPDDRVAICLEPGLPMLVALLATLKAGAAYVPLDPGYPADRLAYMLNDSAPVALLTESALRSHLSNPVMPVVLLDTDAAAIALRGETNPEPHTLGLDPSHLAYVIYTSGSTGLPKGVMVDHANVTRLFATTRDWFGFGADDVWTLFHSFSFDFSVWEIWGALLHGGKLVIVPAACARAPHEFYSLLCREGVTVLNQTPSAFRQLIEAAASDATPHALRTIVFGGEALELSTLAPWIERNDPERTRLINMYGITEITVHASYRPISAADVAARQGSVIGVPLPDLTLYVLDRHLEPAPVGVGGELYVGGAGLARGYLNRPELTAERFINDPFSALPGARLYKTGDLALRRADGELEYLGRNDFQVKIRGYRIELGEIEACLARCEGVRQAVVIAREDQPGDQRLVAYLIAQDDTVLSALALRQQLSDALAAYMVPAAFVTVASFPLTANGKLDRAALPAPDQGALASRDYAAPQGETETAIAAIWCDLLGLEQVGRHDDFFELGGHSLLAVQLVSRVRLAFGAEIALRDVFEAPTLCACARTIAAASAALLPPILAAERSQALPLSWAQQRLWFQAQFDPAASMAYHMPFALRLQGTLRQDVLRAALQAIVDRHESLRTGFFMRDGEPVQRIAPPGRPFSLPAHDLRGLSDLQRDASYSALSQAESRAPFDLAEGPLIRGQLLRIADDEHILLLTQHHIVSDGWSIGVLVRELSALYGAFSQGQADPLAPLALQYADYAVWQRAWLQGVVREGQVGFWRGHLAGAPALLDLPTDRARPALQSYAGASIALTLPRELCEQLRRLNQRHGTTMFMTLLSAWSLLMARLSGQDDVVIGTPVANRRQAEVEPLIGFFVNMLALRVRVPADAGVPDLLAQVKSTTLAAYAHQDLPFEQVVEAVQPPRDLSHSPIFQSMLTLESSPQRNELHLQGLQLTTLALPTTHTPFDLALSLQDTGEEISGTLDYASDLFDAATVARWAGHFETLLGAFAAHEGLAVSRLALLSEAQREQLHGFNPAPAAPQSEGLIHRMFEAQAQARPDALALVHEDMQLNYGELNARANALAARLRALGVGPDARVAICVQRGIGMVVGLLAILKAGGAYVPLDPAYPLARLAYMLEDSAPVVLLTQTALVDGLPELAMPVLLLDGPDAGAAPAEGNVTVPGLDGESLAYVIYTSGSTGMPKGVMNQHGGLCNLVASQIALFGVEPESRVLQFASFSFDASVSEIMMALCRGASLHLAAREALFPGEPLLATLLQERITHVTLPSSVLAACIDDPRLGYLTLVVAGEACPPALAAKWSRRHRFINAYGPTEGTVCATTYECAPDHAGPVPIGRPLPNTRIHVLDQHGQEVPLGVTGEIHIGGAGVARGYLNRPELTAERFIADPFAQAPARLYRTGDLGRWHADGNLEYLGRNDFQVKLRGFRIELGEIEARLAACEGVREALVLSREDTPGDVRLVAYVRADEGVDLQAGLLRTQLAAELAEHMVPSAFVVLAAFPLTPNGKVDRKALPAPGAAVASAPYEAPQGEVENAIAQVWQELLAVPRVGRDDHFFELGGHSLLASRVSARLRDQFGIELAVIALFQAPTIRALAEVVFEARTARFDVASIDSMHAELDDLSEEELLRLLEQEEALSADDEPLNV